MPSGISSRLDSPRYSIYYPENSNLIFRLLTMISIIQALLIYGMVVVGDPLSATGNYGVACVGAPDSQAEDNGIKLGKRVAEIVKKLFG